MKGSYVLQLQRGGRLRPDLSGERGVIDERMPIGGDDRLKPASPSARAQFPAEAQLDHPDRDGGRGRGAEQRNQGSITRWDDFRPEFQNAALPWIALDDLHPHSRNLQLPVLRLRTGI